ncbi:hypothetical protein [Novosphingopyxis sp.]|uniref:hypothetical protein n=1 Tax=Novosphingopyxis sp. TaxID=2709690 RepID=UPI003B5B1937
MSGRAADQEADAREQALFGLMAVAEEQQAAVRAALAGLAAQQAALERQGASLERQAEAVRAEAAGLRRVAGEVGPGLARSTREAAAAAVERGLAGAGETATTAVEAAARPLLESLSGVTAQAGAVEASLRRVVGWATWRLLGRGLLVVVGLAGLLWLAQGMAWWWDQRALEGVRAQTARLEAQVAELKGKRDALEANRDELEQSGLLAKIERCGSRSRLCVRVDERAGAFGTASDYRVLLGY